MLKKNSEVSQNRSRTALYIRMYYNLILRTDNSTCNNIGLLADAQRQYRLKTKYIKSSKERRTTKQIQFTLIKRLGLITHDVSDSTILSSILMID